MRMSSILFAYFIIGATMWGGGAIQWDQSGVGQMMIETPNSNLDPNEDTARDLENSGGPIEEAVRTVGGGGLIAVWNFVMKIIGYLFWPITALQSVNAPPRLTVLLGGGLVTAMVGAFIRLVRQSG